MILQPGEAPLTLLRLTDLCQETGVLPRTMDAMTAAARQSVLCLPVILP